MARKKDSDVHRAKKAWRLLPHDRGEIDKLAKTLKTSPIVAQLLLNRGVTDPADALKFLQIPMSGLHDPERLPGITEAAQRVMNAAQDGRKICIFGDYDVDGVTGTSILVMALRKLGADVDFHVPDRQKDGYGLNNETLQAIVQDGTSLVVTVDCGIASIEEAEEARRLGLELIVTDHHELKAELPRADVLVHPRLPGSQYPFGGLSGAGVAFKLAWSICKLASGGDKVTPKLRDYLLDAVALAAMGTVADVMPLIDENRIFVRHGLARLQHYPTVGLRALLKASGMENKSEISAMDIGFGLAPRINAAGRLGSAENAVKLMITESPEEAEDLAAQLNDFNANRQHLEKEILTQARMMAERSDNAKRPALVLFYGDWHTGLIGIVAGRLADLYGRPTLMITSHNRPNLAIGSGRSVPGLPLHEALEACSSHLIAHGGHAAAAGFRLRSTAIQVFREEFCKVVSEHFSGQVPTPTLTLDAEVPLSALTFNLVQAMGKLEPYGASNPQPLLLTGGLKVAGEPRRVGNGDRHLSFKVRQNGKDMKAIAFGMGERIDELMSEEGDCALAYTPRINEWNGYRSVEIHVKDIQAGAKAKLS
ncbi:MAG: single-stranded-DNA-specific exonuclease RecJ [Gemmataceae bacterium]